jgi:hypothetical protein
VRFPAAARRCRTQKAVDKLAKSFEGDVRTGAVIVRRCPKSRCGTIAQNGSRWRNHVIKSERKRSLDGFNAEEEKVQDLVHAGVSIRQRTSRDSKLVTIAGLLTTEA